MRSAHWPLLLTLVLISVCATCTSIRPLVPTPMSPDSASGAANVSPGATISPRPRATAAIGTPISPPPTPNAALGIPDFTDAILFVRASDVILHDLASGQEHAVLRGAYDLGPDGFEVHDFLYAWPVRLSPDGRWLVVPTPKNGTWLASIDGIIQRQIAPVHMAVSWAPDSRRITFTYGTNRYETDWPAPEAYAARANEVYVQDVIGNAAPRLLARLPGKALYPIWSPGCDGTPHVATSDCGRHVFVYAACQSAAGGICEAWLIDVASGETRLLGRYNGGLMSLDDSARVWSPAGDEVWLNSVSWTPRIAFPIDGRPPRPVVDAYTYPPGVMRHRDITTPGGWTIERQLGMGAGGADNLWAVRSRRTTRIGISDVYYVSTYDELRRAAAGLEQKQATLRPLPGAGEPSQWTAYESPGFGVRLQAPAGWRFEEQFYGDRVFSVVLANFGFETPNGLVSLDEDRLEVTLRRWTPERPGATTAEDILAGWSTNAGAIAEAMTVGGRPAVRARSRISPVSEQIEVPFESDEVVIVRQPLSLTQDTVFQQILASIEFSEPISMPPRLSACPDPGGQPIRASRPLTIELVAQLGGTMTFPGRTINTMAVQGKYVYAGVGPRLVVWDVTDPGQPVEAGQTDSLPGSVEWVAVSGNYAYLVDRRGLQVVDVSDPAHPIPAGRFDIAAQTVVLQGNYAYLGGMDGLHVIDVSDPFAPREVGAYTTGAYVPGVAVAGNRAFAQSEGGLNILDITDPTHPVLVFQYERPPYGIYSVMVAGDIAYVGTEFGLAIVDVSDPAAPRELSFSLQSVWISDIDLVGSHAYVIGSGVLYLLDLADLTHPREVGRYQTPGWAGSLVVAMPNAISGRLYAFLTEGARQDTGGGLWTLDVTDPTDPVPVDYAQRGLTTALDVAVAGDYAYVAGGEAGLAVVDVSEPTAPHVVASIDLQGYAWAVTIAGDILAVAGADDQATGSLSLFVISDPKAPRQIGQYTGGGTMGDVAIAGTPGSGAAPAYAFLADTEWGLSILDISDPAHPVEVWSPVTDEHALGVTLAGDPTNGSRPAYAYVGDGASGGLRIFDVSNPHMPVESGRFRSRLHKSGYTEEAAVAGHYAYIADGGGLVTADVSNPAQPRDLRFYDTMGHASGVALAPRSNGGPNATEPDYVLVAADDLHLVNVADPCAPTQAGILETPGGARNVVVVEDTAYVAADRNGLLILRLLWDDQ